MAKQIPVSGGKAFALVDDDDFEVLSKFTWALSGSYATCKQGGPSLMHRIVIKAGDFKKNGVMVDHINHNPLDNRKSNLRLCSAAENLANSKLSKLSTTGFKGVTYSKKHGRWIARIQVNGKKISLGRFETSQEAAMAYDAAAINHFGEFALTNVMICGPIVIPEAPHIAEQFAAKLRAEEMARAMDARPVAGFSGYWVTANGEVWRNHKPVRRLKVEFRRLAPVANSHGYLVVQLQGPSERKLKKVHRLVLEAFVGPAPEGYVAYQIDGNRGNVNLDNLQWRPLKEQQPQ